MKKYDKAKLENDYKDFFINTYEHKIEELRTYYYQHKNETDDDEFEENFELTTNPKLLIKIITSIFVPFTLLAFNINIIATLIILLISLIISALVSFYLKKYNTTKSDLYKKEIRKLGYYTIGDYEIDLEEYITGPNGIYNTKLQEIINKVENVNDTSIIYGKDNTKYIVWFTTNNSNEYNTFNLIKYDFKEKPIIQTYNFNQIKYYRVDYENKEIIIKLDKDILVFDESAIVTFSKYLKGKEKNNIDNIDELINEYEIYIRSMKSNYDLDKENRYYNQLDAKKYLPASFFLLFICIIFNKLSFNIYILKLLIDTIASISIAIINIGFYSFFEYHFTKNSNTDIINELRTNHKCIEKFNELKIALGINDNYDTIYSKDNFPYIIWRTKEYIHLFLNIIYTNAVYMEIKVADIKYYKTNTECIIKTPEIIINFKPEAYEIIEKLIPEKKGQ